MELVEGETLADRIARGPIPIDEALPLAKQIAEALEAAHEQGIIHRDLKPANIKVRPDGSVKVLDFGLAKLGEAVVGGPQSVAGLSLSPTITSPALMTGVGLLLGTAAYMSPEQAKGKSADKRADIWAFGCVLFEMLAGRRAFDGESVAETLGAVIHKEPDWAALPAGMPYAIALVLRRCLAKSTRERARDMGDVALDLQGASREERLRAASTQALSRRSLLVPIAATVVVTAIVAAAMTALVYRRVAQAPRLEPITFNMTVADLADRDVTTSGAGASGVRLSIPHISPDGRHMALIVNGAGGRRNIWIRSLDAVDLRPLAGTEDVDGLFWSPDSRYIAFSALGGGFASGRLKKVDIAGGSPVTLCDLPGNFRGGTWNRRGIILFSSAQNGLFRLNESGGMPLAVGNDRRATLPSFLPDGEHFLYSTLLASGTANAALGREGLYVASLTNPPTETSGPKLLPDATGGRYTESESGAGFLLIVRDNHLVAQPFDATHVALAGSPTTIADDVFPGANTTTSFSVSDTGIVAFLNAAGPGDESKLEWFDRRGQLLGQIGPPGRYGDVRLSLDNRTVALDALGAQSQVRHVWTADIRRNTFTVLNPSTDGDTGQTLSPDGRVAYTSLSGDIYVKQANGVGDAELFAKSPTTKHPNDWSHDGRFIIYDDHHPTQKQDLYVLPVTGDRKPIPFVVTPADETEGAFSPGDRWVAYSSDESGRRDVYVRDFAPTRVPATAAVKVVISTSGGYKPRWNPNGKELFYIALDGTMMSVPISATGATLEAGTPAPLFKTRHTGFFAYDVAADGRFLINTLSEDTATQATITVMVNWQSKTGARGE